MCCSGPPGSQSFPKSRRLRKRVEFQKVYEQGARIRGACFTVFNRDTGASAPGRVGLTVPARVGGSVVRSRVKRRLRELIRRHWEDLPQGCEVVFHVYAAIVRTGNDELEGQVRTAFRESARISQNRREPRKRPG